MAGMKTSVVIDRPVEKVFQFFLNPKENAPKMDPLGGGLVLMSPDGPPGPGTTFVFRQQVFGKTRETKTHLTAVEPNQRIKFDAEIGPMRPACSLSFEPLASSTRVTFRGDSNPPDGLRFLTPLMNRIIKFDAEIGPMRPACSLSFEPLASSTRVTFRGDSNPPDGLRFLTPLMNRMGQKNWTQRFAQAKAVLEAPDQ